MLGGGQQRENFMWIQSHVTFIFNFNLTLQKMKKSKTYFLLYDKKTKKKIYMSPVILLCQWKATQTYSWIKKIIFNFFFYLILLFTNHTSSIQIYFTKKRKENKIEKQFQKLCI